VALDRLVGLLNDLYRLSGSARVHADTVRTTGVDVTRTGLQLLSLVADAPRATTTDLAATAGVSQPTASRVMQALEADDLVVRHSSDSDGRVSHWTVSAAGRRALAKVHRYHLDRLAEALADLDEARQQEIVSAVDELVTRFHAVPARTRRRSA
jgi:DNA-binding MarR family transcriptional regulator